MKLTELSKVLENIHHAFAIQAGRSVNVALTLRNWLIGFYIKEYEQSGQDRAKYGNTLLQTLAKKLRMAKIPSTSLSSLKQYRQFYEKYREIGQTASGQLQELLSKKMYLEPIGQTLSGQLLLTKVKENKTNVPRLPATKLISDLSYSHFAELIKIEDSLKRSFYEMESIRGNWGSRELRRQISTLYYERLGLSKNKEKLSKMVATGTYAHDIRDVIREPYMFEFVGIKKEEVTEATLADALLNKLNNFFLEMGKGFCFEASNKKILIGDQFFFIDLVLYHRVLKCSCLVELKLNEFKHEHLSQLNTYVNYYKKHEMHPGDNPPVGLLLCAEKDETLVEFAIGGMDNKLFVSKYILELPSKNEIQSFLEKNLRALAPKLPPKKVKKKS